MVHGTSPTLVDELEDAVSPRTELVIVGVLLVHRAVGIAVIYLVVGVARRSLAKLPGDDRAFVGAEPERAPAAVS